MSELVSTTLYEKRFGPYFCEPVIAGLNEVFICIRYNFEDKVVLSMFYFFQEWYPIYLCHGFNWYILKIQT